MLSLLVSIHNLIRKLIYIEWYDWFLVLTWDDVSDIDLMRLHNTRCMFNGGVGGWLWDRGRWLSISWRDVWVPCTGPAAGKSHLGSRRGRSVSRLHSNTQPWNKACSHLLVCSTCVYNNQLHFYIAHLSVKLHRLSLHVLSESIDLAITIQWNLR